MQIDWFTLLAQIVNLLVLLFLLRRFLYKPVLRVMEERRHRVTAQLEEAEAKRQQAEQERQHYHEERQELEQKRDELVTQAREEAEQRQKELLKEARSAVDEEERRWRRAIQREKSTFLQSLRQQLVKETGQLIRRALRDLADTDLEERVVAVFVERLKGLEGEEKDKVVATLAQGGEAVTVRTAFRLSDASRDRLTGAVHDLVPGAEPPQIRFDSSPDLICGIELQLDGQQVAWSVRSYLEGVEEQLQQMIERETETSRERTGQG